MSQFAGVRRPAALVAICVATLLWVAALAAAPIIGSRPETVPRMTAAAIYAGGSLICHQRPERSFHLAGAQLPVCARCLGLYVGGLVGAVAWAAFAGLGVAAASRTRLVLRDRRVRTMLIVAAVPTLMSVLLAMMGWWDGTNTIRALIGIPAGIATGACVSAVAAGDLK